MPQFKSIVKNERYSIGCTGQTVWVWDKNNTVIAKFKDLFYAYRAMISPRGDIFIVRSNEEKLIRYDRFSDALQNALSPTSIPYTKENDHPPMTGWNQPSPNFAYTMNCSKECDLALSLETAYFGTESNRISTDMLIRLGRNFAKAIREYIEVTKETYAH